MTENVILVVVGFLLGLLPDLVARLWRARAHRAALRVEIKLCEKHARTYLGPTAPKEPLYRLPTAAFTTSLPALLLEVWRIDEAETLRLVEFANWVQDINRGLDNVHDSYTDPSRQVLEANRVELKMQHLLKMIENMKGR